MEPDGLNNLMEYAPGGIKSVTNRTEAAANAKFIDLSVERSW